MKVNEQEKRRKATKVSWKLMKRSDQDSLCLASSLVELLALPKSWDASPPSSYCLNILLPPNEFFAIRLSSSMKCISSLMSATLWLICWKLCVSLIVDPLLPNRRLYCANLSMSSTGLSNCVSSNSCRRLRPAETCADILLAGLLESIVWSLPDGPDLFCDADRLTAEEDC